jgi:hypothetical protein
MFCFKEKLAALIPFTRSKDNTRPVLKNILFDGDKAIACNGSILGIVKFPKDEYAYPDVSENPLAVEQDKPFSVKVSTIENAIKNLPKKTILCKERGVFVDANKAVVDTREGIATFEETCDQDYPKYEQVIPPTQVEDTVLGLGKANIAAILDSMTACNSECLMLRIPQNSNKGYVTGAVHFKITGKNEITGNVMPYRVENNANEANVPVLQVEVGQMLDLLLDLAPQNEFVRDMAYKYKKLVGVTENADV